MSSKAARKWKLYLKDWTTPNAGNSKQKQNDPPHHLREITVTQVLKEYQVVVRKKYRHKLKE